MNANDYKEIADELESMFRCWNIADDERLLRAWEQFHEVARTRGADLAKEAELRLRKRNAK